MRRDGIDIVVVNYRTPKDLRQFAESLKSNLPKVPVSLIVVNNEVRADDLDACKFIHDLLGLDVELEFLNSPKNLHFSGGCNAGVALGDRDIIGIFNADTRFLNNTIDKCYFQLVNNGSYGSLGPLQFGDKNEVTHAGIFGSYDKPQHRGWQQRLTGEYRDVRPAVTVSGAALFTPREVWNEMHSCSIYRKRYPDVEGPFLPTPHYFEETWYNYHLQAHGYTCLYYGKAEMIHRWHKASAAGGWADKQFPISREMFREMCDLHGIPRD